MQIVRIFAAIIGWLAVMVALVGLTARSLDTTRQSVLIVAAAAPYLLAVSLVAIATMALARQKIGLAVALCVAVAGVFTQAPLFFTSSVQSFDGPEITVLQANIWLGNADAEALVRQVREQGVDVLTVNELTPQARERLAAAGLDEALPHSFARPGDFADGTGIWSKYPLSDEREYDNFAMFQLSAKVNLPGEQWVSVYAFHPVPPWPTESTQWASEMDEIARILGEIPADSGPVIVSGDFNATHDHAKYRALVSGRFRDAGQQLGAGIQNTYPANGAVLPPLIAIDHIASSGASPTSVRSVVIDGSDHRGMLATFRLPGVL